MCLDFRDSDCVRATTFLDDSMHGSPYITVLEGMKAFTQQDVGGVENLAEAANQVGAITTNVDWPFTKKASEASGRFVAAR
jgi:hypothetical protein